MRLPSLLLIKSTRIRNQLKMLNFVLVALAVILSSADALDKTKIMDQPPPMKGFAVNPSLGRWYVTYRSASCSWSGSSEFTDFEQILSMERETILLKETWRNDMCSTITSRMFIQTPPGVYKVKDPIGNTQSGVIVVPAIAYKSFSVSWGCTKFAAIGNKCNDPWISIKTRFPFPGPGTIAKINSALKSLWGISLDQLQKVQHGKSCVAGHAYHGGHVFSAKPASAGGYSAHGTQGHNGYGSQVHVQTSYALGGYGGHAGSDDDSSDSHGAYGHGYGHKKAFNY